MKVRVLIALLAFVRHINAGGEASCEECCKADNCQDSNGDGEGGGCQCADTVSTFDPENIGMIGDAEQIWHDIADAPGNHVPENNQYVDDQYIFTCQQRFSAKRCGKLFGMVAGMEHVRITQGWKYGSFRGVLINCKAATEDQRQAILGKAAAFCTISRNWRVSRLQDETDECDLCATNGCSDDLSTNLARPPNSCDTSNAMLGGQSCSQSQSRVSSTPWSLRRITQQNERFVNNPVDDDQGYYREDLADGKDVDVYILDTGLQNFPTEFANAEYIADCSANSCRDEEGNGYWHDVDGHGTWVGGCIAGRTTGTAHQAKILGVQVLTDSGWGYTSSILNAFQFVFRRASASGRRSVINGSFGGPLGSDTEFTWYADVFKPLNDIGVVVVLAAGNSESDACQFSPAVGRNDGVITVAASDSGDAKSWFTNWGDCVDLAAPGSAVFTTKNDGVSYDSVSGTSFSSPLTAGVVAHLLSKYPTATPKRISEMIREASSPFENSQMNPTYTETYGWGMLYRDSKCDSIYDNPSDCTQSAIFGFDYGPMSHGTLFPVYTDCVDDSARPSHQTQALYRCRDGDFVLVRPGRQCSSYCQTDTGCNANFLGHHKAFTSESSWADFAWRAAAETYADCYMTSHLTQTESCSNLLQQGDTDPKVYKLVYGPTRGYRDDFQIALQWDATVQISSLRAEAQWDWLAIGSPECTPWICKHRREYALESNGACVACCTGCVEKPECADNSYDCHCDASAEGLTPVPNDNQAGVCDLGDGAWGDSVVVTAGTAISWYTDVFPADQGSGHVMFRITVTNTEDDAEPGEGVAPISPTVAPTRQGAPTAWPTPMPTEYDDFKPGSDYFKQGSGFCQYRVDDFEDCRIASEELGHGCYEERPIDYSSYPMGCYIYLPGNEYYGNVWYNQGPSDVECSDDYLCICRHEPADGPGTKYPTSVPTYRPSSNETTPTQWPTLYDPTWEPEPTPTLWPTSLPSTPFPTSDTPTIFPSGMPTFTQLSDSPTQTPSFTPSPTKTPTDAPSESPTLRPTTASPTRAPTLSPTKYPTPTPTKYPTEEVYPTPYPTFTHVGYYQQIKKTCAKHGMFTIMTKDECRRAVQQFTCNGTPCGLPPNKLLMDTPNRKKKKMPAGCYLVYNKPYFNSKLNSKKKCKRKRKICICRDAAPTPAPTPPPVAMTYYVQKFGECRNKITNEFECNEAAIVVQVSVPAMLEDPIDYEDYPGACYVYDANSDDSQQYFNPHINSTIECSEANQCICKRDEFDDQMGCDVFGCSDQSGVMSLANPLDANHNAFIRQRVSDNFAIITDGFPNRPYEGRHVIRDPDLCSKALGWAEAHYQDFIDPDFSFNYTTTVIRSKLRVDGAYLYLGEAQSAAWCNVFNSDDAPTGIPCSATRPCVVLLDPTIGPLAMKKNMKGMSVQINVANRLGRIEEEEASEAEAAEEPTEQGADEEEDSFDTVEIWSPARYPNGPRLTAGFAVFLAMLAFLNRMSRS